MHPTPHAHLRAHSLHFLKQFEGKITRVDRYSGLIGALQPTTTTARPPLPPALSHRLPHPPTPRQLVTLQSRVGKENQPAVQPTAREQGKQVKLGEVLCAQNQHAKPMTGEQERLHLPRIGGQSLDNSKCASRVMEARRQGGKPRKAIQLQQDSQDQSLWPQLRRIR